MELFRHFIESLKSDIAVYSLVVAIALAFIGYLATYFNARLLAIKKDRLELVNKRLNEFYGPLYVATKAGSTAYAALLKKLSRQSVFEEVKELSEADWREWQVWMKDVFTPLNDIREKIIIEKAYLIREEVMPACLLDFVTHVASYKAVLSKWEKGDFSERYSMLDFPRELTTYATNSYQELKHEQATLLGRREPKRASAGPTCHPPG